MPIFFAGGSAVIAVPLTVIVSPPVKLLAVNVPVREAAVPALAVSAIPSTVTVSVPAAVVKVPV